MRALNDSGRRPGEGAEIGAGASVERFEYVPAELLMRLAVRLPATPRDPRLHASSDGGRRDFAPLLITSGRVPSAARVWRAAFPVPFELAVDPLACWSLSLWDGTEIVLPRPGGEARLRPAPARAQAGPGRRRAAAFLLACQLCAGAAIAPAGALAGGNPTASVQAEAPEAQAAAPEEAPAPAPSEGAEAPAQAGEAPAPQPPPGEGSAPPAPAPQPPPEGEGSPPPPPPPPQPPAGEGSVPPAPVKPPTTGRADGPAPARGASPHPAPAAAPASAAAAAPAPVAAPAARHGGVGRSDVVGPAGRPHRHAAGSGHGSGGHPPAAQNAPAAAETLPAALGEALAGPLPAGLAEFALLAPPPFLLAIYHQAAARYHVPWTILAAINQIETAYGRDLSVSSAGAVGWMQFMPQTWQLWAVDADRDGVADPYSPRDAIFTAARYLQASGAERDLPAAIFAYNHAGWYVAAVLLRARMLAGRSFAAPLHGGYSLPLDARYLHELGRTDDGVDIETAPDGALVYSITPGVVSAVAADPAGFGPAYPVVEATAGPLTGQHLYYGHVARALVRPGEAVAAGQPIAIVGHTGNAASLGHGHIEIGFSDAGGAPLGHGGATPATAAGAAMRTVLVELCGAFGIPSA